MIFDDGGLLLMAEDNAREAVHVEAHNGNVYWATEQSSDGSKAITAGL